MGKKLAANTSYALPPDFGKCGGSRWKVASDAMMAAFPVRVPSVCAVSTNKMPVRYTSVMRNETGKTALKI